MFFFLFFAVILSEFHEKPILGIQGIPVLGCTPSFLVPMSFFVVFCLLRLFVYFNKIFPFATENGVCVCVCMRVYVCVFVFVCVCVGCVG